MYHNKAVEEEGLKKLNAFVIWISEAEIFICFVEKI